MGNIKEAGNSGEEKNNGLVVTDLKWRRLGQLNGPEVNLVQHNEDVLMDQREVT